MSLQSAINNPESAVQAEAFNIFAACRLERTSATTVALKAYKGLGIMVDSEFQILPVAGLSNNLLGDNTIDASGADSGATPVANRIHYAYISNSAAPDFPGSLRLATTAPTADAEQGYVLPGVSYWRFVGTVYVGAGVTVTDSVTRREVQSYYNRLPAAIFFCAGYNNNNAVNNYTPGAASAVWTAFAPGAVILQATFIRNPEDSDLFGCVISKTAGAGAVGVGLALDSVISPDASIDLPALAGVAGSMQHIYDVDPAAAFGLHTLSVLYHDNGALIPTFELDGGRNGAAADVPTSYLWGQVWR